jgi:hypothetical protein
MSRHYSDPSRETDDYALPNVEVFYARQGELTSEDGEDLDKGWYYWYCFPGCLPDSEPCGPYATEAEALAYAQKTTTSGF